MVNQSKTACVHLSDDLFQVIRYDCQPMPPVSDTPTQTRPEFANYEEFFAYYVKQHVSPMNRFLHACGTLAGLSILVIAIITGHPWYGLLWIPVAYGFAWTGHFLIEGNKPATFGHPWWSFISDFRMLGLMAVGKLGPYLKN